jgi:hypothetical protein
MERGVEGGVAEGRLAYRRLPVAQAVPGPVVVQLAANARAGRAKPGEPCRRPIVTELPHPPAAAAALGAGNAPLVVEAIRGWSEATSAPKTMRPAAESQVPTSSPETKARPVALSTW